MFATLSWRLRALCVCVCVRVCVCVCVCVRTEHGLDYSGFSRISGFTFLSESSKIVLRCTLSVLFRRFRIQTLTLSPPPPPPWNCVHVIVFGGMRDLGSVHISPEKVNQ